MSSLSRRTSYSISGASLHSRNKANSRYNLAIEAQKQKECHPLNLSTWCDSDSSEFESWISQSRAREVSKQRSFCSTTSWW